MARRPGAGAKRGARCAPPAARAPGQPPPSQPASEPATTGPASPAPATAGPATEASPYRAGPGRRSQPGTVRPRGQSRGRVARAGRFRAGQDHPEVLSPHGDVPGGLGAGRGILAGEVGDQRGDRGRHEGRQRGDAPVQVREGHGQRLARERDLPGQALMRDDTERVQVGRGRRGNTRDPFRGQVGRGPDQHPGLGHGLRHRSFPGRGGDPEVGDLDQAIQPDQQVPGLDVPVDQAGLVRGGQSPGRLGDDIHHVPGGQRPVVQDPGQGQPFHQLHDEVPRFRRPGFPVVEDLGDVRVRQRARMMRLGAEPGQPVLIIGVLRAQQLDRYSPVNGQVGTPPDIPHTAGRNERIQPVAVPQHKPSTPTP